METRRIVTTALGGLGLGGLGLGGLGLVGLAGRAEAQEVAPADLGPLPRAHVVSLPFGDDDTLFALDLLATGEPAVSLRVELFEDTVAVDLAAALAGFAATVRVASGAPELAIAIGPGGEARATAQLAFVWP
jgi:hypothetical protein